jgi:hypothetical protein
MLELRRVVVVDGRRNIEAYGEQIPFDVANRRSVCFQAVHGVLDVLVVDLEQPFLNQRRRKAVAGHRNRRTRGVRFTVVVVLPTPPFWFVTAMI